MNSVFPLSLKRNFKAISKAIKQKLKLFLGKLNNNFLNVSTLIGVTTFALVTFWIRFFITNGQSEFEVTLFVNANIM
jgi:hypothetical protein